jgi:hypothetical protein
MLIKSPPIQHRRERTKSQIKQALEKRGTTLNRRRLKHRTRSREMSKDPRDSFQLEPDYVEWINTRR